MAGLDGSVWLNGTPKLRGEPGTLPLLRCYYRSIHQCTGIALDGQAPQRCLRCSGPCMPSWFHHASEQRPKTPKPLPCAWLKSHTPEGRNRNLPPFPLFCRSLPIGGGVNLKHDVRQPSRVPVRSLQDDYCHSAYLAYACIRIKLINGLLHYDRDICSKIRP